MKKNTLTKILFILLVVLLAFSVVACGGKDVPDDPDNGNGNGEEEENEYATVADIAKIIDGLDPLIANIGAIDDEMYVELAFIVEFDNNVFRVEIEADIDGNDPSENIVALKVHEETATPSLLVEAYLVEDVIYINQMITANPGKAKFSNLDALEISKNLSKLPGMIAEQDISDLTDMIDGIMEILNSIAGPVNEIVAGNEVLTFEETADEYRLIINSEGLGKFIYGLMGPDGIVSALMDGDDDEEEEGDELFDEIIGFVLKLLFSVETIDELADAETDDFPELSIVARRDGTTVTGLSIDYNGIFDPDRGREDISLGIDVVISSSALGNIQLPSDLDSNYVESVIKASVTIDLGLKDLFLQADILANPDLSGDIVPTAYLAAVDDQGDPITDLDAYYDGTKLSFDLKGLYEMFDVDYSGVNTQYYVDLVFADLFDSESGDPGDPGDPGEPGEPDEEDWDLPFEITDNLMGRIVSKINTLYNIVIDTVFSQELSLDVVTILGLIDGVFVDAEDTSVKFDMEDMTDYLEGVLAEYASDEFLLENPTADDADKAQSVIFEITGADLSVSDILQATASGDGNAEITIAMLEDALGLNLTLLTGGGDSVLDFTVEFDLVAATAYVEPTKDYSGAIDLNSEYDEIDNPTDYNIYEEEGVKKYVILDELFRILDAYRLYNSGYTPEID